MAERAAAAAAQVSEKVPAAKAAGGDKEPREKRPALDHGMTIKILVEANPKREGSKSRERFAIYRNGMTIAQFIEKGGLMADVRYDEDHKFIELHPAAK